MPRYFPFAIVLRPSVIRVDGDQADRVEGPPVVFEGPEAHVEAIAWLQAYPETVRQSEVMDTARAAERPADRWEGEGVEPVALDGGEGSEDGCNSAEHDVAVAAV